MSVTTSPRSWLAGATVLARQRWREIVVLDVETTGFNPYKDSLLEIAAIRFAPDGRMVSARDWLCDPGRPIPKVVTDLTHITDRMVRGKPSPEERVEQLAGFARGADILRHGGSFDLRFLRAKHPGLFDDGRVLFDTLEIARAVFPGKSGHKLEDLAGTLNFRFDHRKPHRAWSDAQATRACFFALIDHCEDLPAAQLAELRAAVSQHGDGYRIFFTQLVQGNGLEGEGAVPTTVQPPGAKPTAALDSRPAVVILAPPASHADVLLDSVRRAFAHRLQLHRRGTVGM